MTRRLGVIGYPLSHSISPPVHQAALDHLGIDARYEVWETLPSDLTGLLDRMRNPEFMGASVTIPHKETVALMMDELSPAAAAIGAVNCIAGAGGRLVGHNTDGGGFITALKKCAGFTATGRSVLLIGAGGAAKAIGHALLGEGVSSLTIANRTRARAESLAADLPGPAVAASLDPSELADAAAGADLIVNSTSVGMSSGDGAGESPIAPDLIAAGALVNDIVYSPPETPLMRAGRARGARVLGGLAMLIYQGAAAFELWTGREPPVEVMLAAGERALAVHR